MVRILT